MGSEKTLSVAILRMLWSEFPRNKTTGAAFAAPVVLLWQALPLGNGHPQGFQVL